MTRVAHRATRCALSGTARDPVENPSTCGSSLIAYEILSKQPEPPLSATRLPLSYQAAMARKTSQCHLLPLSVHIIITLRRIMLSVECTNFSMVWPRPNVDKAALRALDNLIAIFDHYFPRAVNPESWTGLGSGNCGEATTMAAESR